MQIIPIAGLAAPSARVALAAPPELDPEGPQAAALGYGVDATKAGKAKFRRTLRARCASIASCTKARPGTQRRRALSSRAGQGWSSVYAKKA